MSSKVVENSPDMLQVIRSQAEGTVVRRMNEGGDTITINGFPFEAVGCKGLLRLPVKPYQLKRFIGGHRIPVPTSYTYQWVKRIYRSTMAGCLEVKLVQSLMAAGSYRNMEDFPQRGEEVTIYSEQGYW